MKSNSRLSRWKKDKESSPVLFEHPINPRFEILLKESSKKKEEEKTNFSNYTLTKLALEFIFDIKNNVPVIHVISPVFDTNKFDIRYDHFLDILFSGDDKEIEKEVINSLGLAVALEVPIFPNNAIAEKKLSYYYQKLISEGFTAPDENGEDVKLIPTNAKRTEDFKIENFKNINLTNYWSASDLLLLRDSVKNELMKLNNAHRTLTYLEVAIKEFADLLKSETRNENRLQETLTKNPILFGLEYSNIIPKHKLGAEYEVDYALERFSGLIDLMEIESSALQLFTKAGNPSSHLVHAEQQVIDWLDWIEKNGSYARQKLQGLVTPKGYIIIGRSSDLTDKTKASLIRRNKAFNGLINILTYDDVLLKARTMVKILSHA
ncbi:protein of unknown function [Pedobacter terrae]|uniref:Shedu protein SduA C-terminal domain-containing protein n=1 Tax=Pedobacter terrae TaxID=405671 RepID=A0A1G7W486_9SPHI|nr:Shedu anti-phage system protein SduA domain-containing protein [Pedobacter terrae]SDG66825.1 protein of unknown function [Pedobacter terrae]